MTWRRFCDDFCRTKKYYMFKTLANRSRRVRDACEDFAIPCERFATVRDGLRESIRKPIANSSHPSEIGAIVLCSSISRVCILVTSWLKAFILELNVPWRVGCYSMSSNYRDLVPGRG